MTTVVQSTTTYGSGERRFLASAYGTQNTLSVTLLMSDFTEGTHFPDGYILAGQTVSLGIGATYFMPGSDTPATGDSYIILSDTPVPTGATHVGVGVMRRGDIIEAALPEAPSASVRASLVTQGFTFV